MSMVVHQWFVREGIRFGVPATITGTLCGRSNKASEDGMNSGDAEEVTCKFCLKIMERKS